MGQRSQSGPCEYGGDHVILLLRTSRGFACPTKAKALPSFPPSPLLPCLLTPTFSLLTPTPPHHQFGPFPPLPGCCGLQAQCSRALLTGLLREAASPDRAPFSGPLALLVFPPLCGSSPHTGGPAAWLQTNTVHRSSDRPVSRAAWDCGFYLGDLWFSGLPPCRDNSQQPGSEAACQQPHAELGS